MELTRKNKIIMKVKFKDLALGGVTQWIELYIAKQRVAQ